MPEHPLLPPAPAVAHDERSRAARPSVSARMRFLAPVCLSVLLLAAYQARGLFRPPPPGAGRYLHRLRALAKSVPHNFGPWRGRDVPLPRAAVSMLRPNVDMCRQFTNIKTGLHATLMIIDCSDTRHLSGHYPPNCYPGNGWQLLSGHPQNWTVHGVTITGEEYAFHRGSFEAATHISVADFFIMPDGRFLRTMKQFIRDSGSFRDRFFGAAQVELVLPGDTLPADRVKLFQEIVGKNWKLINAIRRGVKP